MSGGSFPAGWLALREPFDHAARSADLVARLDAALPSGRVTLLDLGCGLGSDLRYVAPRLDRDQHWILVDHDPDLLASVPAALERWARARGEAFSGDGRSFAIGRRWTVELALRDLRAPEPWPDADALLTQALLDLVDVSFLERVVGWLDRRRPLLAALTVDGRVHWHPSDPDDDDVQAAFRAHQLGDRGFGPSPGPRAAAWLAGRLAAEGFAVELREADWRIPADATAMLLEMARGTARAAGEVLGPDRVAPWTRRREEHGSAGLLSLRVGHLDLLAVTGRGPRSPR